MFNSRLTKRIKSIEKTLVMEDHVFYFEDGSKIEITANQFKQLWDDIHNLRHNTIYEKMKQKLDEGFPDDAGLIHLMKAEDPNEYKNLWSDYKEG